MIGDGATSVQEHSFSASQNQDRATSTVLWRPNMPAQLVVDHKTSRVPPATNIHSEALQRVGIIALVTLVLAFSALVGISGFLTFLWFGDEGDPRWRNFIEKGEVTRGITLSSVVVRVSISTTAGIYTAMLAAIMIENHEVLLRDAANTSAMRFIHSPPSTMLPAALRSLERMNLTITFPLLLLIGTTVLSQLCSTALVSDLQTVQISGTSQTAYIAYTFSPQKDAAFLQDYSEVNLYQSSSSLGTPLASFYRFAESSEPAAADQHQFMHDTGPVMRAYLPLSSSQDREAVRNYTGILVGADHRVRCYRPLLSSASLTKAYTMFRGYQDTSAIVLNGSIDASPEAGLATHSRDLSCIVPGSVNPAIPGQQASLCALTDNSTVSGSAIHAYAVIQSSGNLYNFYSNHSLSQSLWIVDETFSASSQNEWLTLNSDESSNDAFRFSLSFCLASFNTSTANISVSSDKYIREQVYPFQDKTVKGLSVPAQLDKLLGPNSAMRFTSTDRGVLSLDSGKWTAANGRVYRGMQSDLGSSAQKPQTGATSIMACAACGCPVVNFQQNTSVFNCVAPSKDHILLFQHGLTGPGGRPAYAVQALLSSVFAQNYYAELPYFDRNASADATFFIQAFAPGSIGGFIAVMTVIVLHIFTCALITAAFFSLTKTSYLNESWYSTAQLLQRDTAEIFARGSKLGWREVPTWSKSLNKSGNGVFCVAAEEKIELQESEKKSDDDSMTTTLPKSDFEHRLSVGSLDLNLESEVSRLWVDLNTKKAA